jgi:transglutaminase-like putative cysteine protease
MSIACWKRAVRLHVRHETTYAYDRPIAGSAQIVRLFPQSHAGLEILSWKVTAAGKTLTPSRDGLGNLYALAVSRRPASQMIVLVQGEVATREGNGALEGIHDPLPPVYFLRTTPLSEADAPLAALGASIAQTNDPARALMARVHEMIEFRPGATTTGVTAAEAFARGAGVCQDHAHIALAAARAADIPARYVSGYLHTGKSAEPASHAWVEIRQGDVWLGIDPANGVVVGEKYVRVAAGLDYEDVAPVRGVRLGGAQERLSVLVDVLTGAEQ